MSLKAKRIQFNWAGQSTSNNLRSFISNVCWVSFQSGHDRDVTNRLFVTVSSFMPKMVWNQFTALRKCQPWSMSFFVSLLGTDTTSSLLTASFLIGVSLGEFSEFFVDLLLADTDLVTTGLVRDDLFWLGVLTIVSLKNQLLKSLRAVIQLLLLPHNHFANFQQSYKTKEGCTANIRPHWTWSIRGVVTHSNSNGIETLPGSRYFNHLLVTFIQKCTTFPSHLVIVRRKTNWSSVWWKQDRNVKVVAISKAQKVQRF